MSKKKHHYWGSTRVNHDKSQRINMDHLVNEDYQDLTMQPGDYIKANDQNALMDIARQVEELETVPSDKVREATEFDVYIGEDQELTEDL